jgi:hypothetical protein
VGAGLGLGVAHEPRQELERGPAADPFAQGLDDAREPDGVLVALLPPRQVGQAEHRRDHAQGAVDGPEQLECLADGGPGLGQAADAGVDDARPDQGVRELEAVPQPAPGGHRLLGAGQRAVQVAGGEVPDHTVPQGPGHPSLVARLAEQLEALLDQPPGGGEVALGAGDEPLVVERVGDAAGVAELPFDGQGLLVEPVGRGDVLLPPGDPAGPGERLGPGRGAPLARRQRQELVEPPPPLGEVPSLLPEAPQRPRGLLGPVGLGGVHGPAEGGAEVGLLEVEAVQPRPLVVGGEVGFGLHRQAEEVLAVAAADQVQVAAGLQLLAGELPQGLQHPEPGLAVGGVGAADQRLVHQRGQPVDGVQPQPLRVADRLRRLDRPAAGEHRQPGEQPPLGGVEQVVAPGDGAAEGPLALREGPGPGGEDREALLQPGQHLLGRQDLGPGGRQLDRQRQAVEPDGDLRHGRGVLGGEAEPGPHRLRPLDEQPHGLGPAEGLEVGEPLRVGQVQRRHQVLLLTAQRQRHAGGDQDLQRRRRAEEVLDHRPGLRHLLEVVDHQQQLLVAEVVLDRPEDGTPGHLRDP